MLKCSRYLYLKSEPDTRQVSPFNQKSQYYVAYYNNHFNITTNYIRSGVENGMILFTPVLNEDKNVDPT